MGTHTRRKIGKIFTDQTFESAELVWICKNPTHLMCFLIKLWDFLFLKIKVCPIHKWSPRQPKKKAKNLWSEKLWKKIQTWIGKISTDTSQSASKIKSISLFCCIFIIFSTNRKSSFVREDLCPRTKPVGLQREAYFGFIILFSTNIFL